MAEPSSALQQSISEETQNVSVVRRHLSFSSKTDASLAEEPNATCSVPSFQSVCRLSAEKAERLPSEDTNECIEEANAAKLTDVSLKQNKENYTEDKENAAITPTDITQGW